jgi:hypothetical protein
MLICHGWYMLLSPRKRSLWQLTVGGSAMLGDIVKAVEVVRNWLAYNRTNRQINQQLLLDAMVELHLAANLTRSYLAEVAINGPEGRARGNQFPRDVRHQLSQSWVEVGRRLSHCYNGVHDRHIEEVLEDLVERCFAKAEFWAAPRDWKKSGIDIQLGNLVRDTADTIDELRERVREPQR